MIEVIFVLSFSARLTEKNGCLQGEKEGGKLGELEEWEFVMCRLRLNRG